ncbi:MAG: hypothetical protein DRJ09_07640 [Bacteroidetes bacterium]|nr:MAG: hypothetical protein DRJ09_07640 [Bacteroidota bacterium]
MSPRTDKQFETIRNEKIKLISKTALKLFAEHGYESTSISMIAKEAGISKGLIYNYFESKVALLRLVMEKGLKEFMSILSIENETIIQRNKIIDFIDRGIQTLIDNPEYYRLYFSLTMQPKVSDLIKNDILPLFDKLFTIFTKYFSQKGETNPYVKTRYLMAVFDGIGIHYLLDIENFPLNEVRDILVAQF